MACATTNIKLQIRRDTSSNWNNFNPTLAAGELGYETDTRKLKVGNGSSNWATLSYITRGVSFYYGPNTGSITGPPDGPVPGDLFLNTTNGYMYIYE